ncbi:hypothetical protein M885DRAFT_508422 [Pelagophyceae sp. CCMP2097]|nr:hypothetical protein M885DRAFT_508422 [Pelagophyceae sp. CCMP2097]
MAVSAQELTTTIQLNPSVASVAFNAPAGWQPSEGALVKLAPGPQAEIQLKGNELGTVASMGKNGARPKWASSRLDGKFNGNTFTPDRLQHGFEGWFPLHAAAALRLGPEALAVLVSADPEAAKIQDADGLLPYALALQYDAPAKAVSLLVGAAGGAVCADGETGLLLAVGRFKYNGEYGVAKKEKDVAAARYFEIVSAVLSADRAAAYKPDAQDILPVIRASNLSAPQDTVLLLLEAAPDAVMENGKKEVFTVLGVFKEEAARAYRNFKPLLEAYESNIAEAARSSIAEAANRLELDEAAAVDGGARGGGAAAAKALKATAATA